MRDPRYPFENDTLYHSNALHKINQLWDDVLSKKDDNKIIQFYNITMSDIEELKRNGLININTRGIRSLERIKDAL